MRFCVLKKIRDLIAFAINRMMRLADTETVEGEALLVLVVFYRQRGVRRGWCFGEQISEVLPMATGKLKNQKHIGGNVETDT